MKRERAINGQLLVKSLLAAANQAAGVVHRGTKNSFPRAGGLKRFKRAFWAVVPVRRAHPAIATTMKRYREGLKQRAVLQSRGRAFFRVSSERPLDTATRLCGFPGCVVLRGQVAKAKSPASSGVVCSVSFEI